LEGTGAGVGWKDVVMCGFTAKNSKNGGERVHLLYEGIEHRCWDVNTFEGYLWVGSTNDLEGIERGDGHQDLVMCRFTPRNSENGKQSAHLV
jgi:hypothetical protein